MISIEISEQNPPIPPVGFCMTSLTKTAIVAKQEENSAAAAEEDEEDCQDDPNDATHLS